MATKKTTASSAATEVKTAASETVKAAEKKTAAKAVKPAAEKKPAAKPVKASKPAAKTAAAAKAVTKAAPAKKTAAKSTTKSTVKTAAKKTTAKKPAKKTAPVVSAETICAKFEKNLTKSKTASIKEKIAVDIEVYGFTEGEASQKMYIEVNEGKAVVSPHSYEAKDFRVAVSLEKALAFVDGKITLKELVSSPEGFYAEGNIAKAVKLASIF